MLNTDMVEDRCRHLEEITFVDYGIEASYDSECALTQFIELYSIEAEPFLELLGNGCYLATWRDNHGTEVSLEFRGRFFIDYTIFLPGDEPTRKSHWVIGVGLNHDVKSALMEHRVGRLLNSIPLQMDYMQLC